MYSCPIMWLFIEYVVWVFPVLVFPLSDPESPVPSKLNKGIDTKLLYPSGRQEYVKDDDDNDDVRVGIFDQETQFSSQIDFNLLGEPRACGYSSQNLNDSNISEPSANLRDWPWMAAILANSKEANITDTLICGGSLITPRHVLTAAHCTIVTDSENDFPNTINIPAKTIKVRLGEYNLKIANESLTIDFGVSEIRNHEDYNEGTNENDISIMYLEKAAQYSIYIQPICLPLPSQDFALKDAFVAGWGFTQKNGMISDVLMEVKVQVWPEEECDERYPQKNYDTALCAGYPEGGKDSCKYDSGGPLMTQRNDGRWIIIGIVSWGVGCADKNEPGVYTTVNKYLDWIAEKTQDIN